MHTRGKHMRFKIRAAVAEYTHGARSVFPLAALNNAGCKDSCGIAGGAFHNGIEDLKYAVVIFVGSAFGGKGTEGSVRVVRRVQKRVGFDERQSRQCEDSLGTRFAEKPFFRRSFQCFKLIEIGRASCRERV